MAADEGVPAPFILVGLSQAG